MSLFSRRPDISQQKVFGCESYVHVPDNQRRKLDAKAHKAVFVGYPHGVNWYKLYDLEKKFLEDNFDHFKETPSVDTKSIFPDMNEGSESVLEYPLNKKFCSSRASWPPDQKNEEPGVPESVKSQIQKNVESAVPQNVEAVGAPNDEAPVKRTYEDKFMEEIRNLDQ